MLPYSQLLELYGSFHKLLHNMYIYIYICIHKYIDLVCITLFVCTFPGLII